MYVVLGEPGNQKISVIQLIIVAIGSFISSSALNIVIMLSNSSIRSFVEEHHISHDFSGFINLCVEYFGWEWFYFFIPSTFFSNIT